MKERPILFSGAMVRAILEGRKTQTRRAMKPQPQPNPSEPGRHWVHASGVGMIDVEGFLCGDDPSVPGCFCPYGQPGDRLWVKETWRTAKSLDSKSPSAIGELCFDAGYSRPWAPLAYDADGYRNSEWRGFEMGGCGMAVDAEPGKTRVSIHMPRWACRLVLEVAGVRVERLQAIRASDAWAEGIAHSPDVNPVHEFEELWASINGQASWDANPWVWVVEFRRVDA